MDGHRDWYERLEAIKAKRGFDDMLARQILPLLKAKYSHEQHKRHPQLQHFLEADMERLVACVRAEVNPKMNAAIGDTE